MAAKLFINALTSLFIRKQGRIHSAGGGVDLPPFKL